MSTSEFLANAGLPPTVQLSSLELTPERLGQIERLIEERSAAVTDYRYPVREQVIARTAMADLKDSERWGAIAGLATYFTVYVLAGRRFGLLGHNVPRRFLAIGSVLVGTGVYHLVTQGAYRNYRGVSYKVNERMSAELSEMMNLKA